MDRRVIYRDNQELTSADQNNAQAFVQEAIDRLVLDAVGAGLYFTGFTHQATGTWEVTLASGRFYANGAIYRRASDTVLDLYNLRPLINKKVVAITAFGQTIETDIQPRDFLINVETGETQPDPVAMESLRSTELAPVGGAEAPQPTAPNISSNAVLVALVTLGTGGIESIERIEDNVLPQTLRNLLELREIALWRGGVGAAIDTIRTDLASLAARFEGYATLAEMNALRDTLDLVKKLAEEALALAKNASPPAIYQFTDSFNDETQSDKAASGYSALIENGVLTFPRAATETMVGGLALQTPNDSRAHVSGNMMLPAFTERLRLDTTKGTDGGSANMLAYSTATHTFTGKQVKNENYVAGAWDYVYRSFVGVPGVAFHANNFPKGSFPSSVTVGDIVYQYSRVVEDSPGSGRWTLVYSYQVAAAVGSPYIREEITNTTNHTAQARSIVFLNANPGWLRKAQLEIEALAEAGDIRAIVQACDGDMPDLGRVYADVTVAYASLKTGLNDFLFQPVYCEPGQRIAVTFFSTGNHRLKLRSGVRATTKGNSYALESANKWVVPAETADKDLSVKLFFATFAKTRAEIDMQTLVLGGGILSLLISSRFIVPPGCEIFIEGYVAGSWYSLTSSSGSRPIYDWGSLNLSAIPIRIAFIGTGDLMPAIGIGPNSTVTVSRIGGALKHVSKQRDVGSGKTVTKAQTRYVIENWDVANTLTPSLVVGGAPVAAASVQDEFVAGRLLRTANFTFSANRYFTPVLTGALEAGKAPMLITERHDSAS